MSVNLGCFLSRLFAVQILGNRLYVNLIDFAMPDSGKAQSFVDAKHRTIGLCIERSNGGDVRVALPEMPQHCGLYSLRESGPA
jgi:hypothetical protein